MRRTWRDCFKQLTQPNLENMTQDIGFYQSQYEQGSYNIKNVYMNFSSAHGYGGLLFEWFTAAAKCSSTD